MLKQIGQDVSLSSFSAFFLANSVFITVSFLSLVSSVDIDCLIELLVEAFTFNWFEIVLDDVFSRLSSSMWLSLVKNTANLTRSLL